MKLTCFALLCAIGATLLLPACRKETTTPATVDKQAITAPEKATSTSLAALPVGFRSGPYRIVNERSGKVLEVELSEINNNGGKVQQWEYLNADNQKWLFTHLGNDVYLITNVASGKALEAQAETANQNGGRVQQWQWLQYGHQQWKLKNSAFINVGSGKVLDLDANTVYVNGGIIQVWDWLNGANQRWTILAP